MAREVSRLDDREVTAYMNVVMMFKESTGLNSVTWFEHLKKLRGLIDPKYEALRYKIDVYLYVMVEDEVRSNLCGYLQTIRSFIVEEMVKYEKEHPK